MSVGTDRANIHTQAIPSTSYDVDGKDSIIERKFERNFSFVVPDGPSKRCNCMIPAKRRRLTPPPRFLQSVSDVDLEGNCSLQEQALLSSISNSNLSFFNRLKNWFSRTFFYKKIDSTWL